MPLYGPPESQEYLQLMRDYIAESTAAAKRMERLTRATAVLTFVATAIALTALLVAVL